MLFRLTFLLIIAEILHGAFKLGLEHVDGLDRISSYVLGQLWRELSQVVQVYFQPRALLANKVLDSLLLLTFAHVLGGGGLHTLLVEGRGIMLADLLVGGVDVHSFGEF